MKAQDNESYSSPAMRERRHRILVEARQLISDRGVAGFSLAELGKRAGVAKQTLYYAFGNKEAVVAAAILDYFEEYEEAIPYRAPPGSLDRLIERQVAIGRRNLTIRNYVAALVSIYFGDAPALWSAMHAVAARSHQAYVERLARSGRLQPWCDAGELVDGMVGQLFITANAWVQGRIADGRMIDRLVLGLLTYLAGAVDAPTRAEVDGAIARIAESGAEAYVAGLR